MALSAGWASLSDGELGARVAGGDELALAALYERYAPGVFDLVARTLGSTEEAPRVVEATFLEVWTTTGGCSGRSEDVRVALFAAAANTALSDLQATKTRRYGDAAISNGPARELSAKDYAVADLRFRRSIALPALGEVLGMRPHDVAKRSARAKQVLEASSSVEAFASMAPLEFPPKAMDDTWQQVLEGIAAGTRRRRLASLRERAWKPSPRMILATLAVFALVGSAVVVVAQLGRTPSSGRVIASANSLATTSTTTVTLTTTTRASEPPLLFPSDTDPPPDTTAPAAQTTAPTTSGAPPPRRPASPAPPTTKVPATTTSPTPTAGFLPPVPTTPDPTTTTTTTRPPVTTTRPPVITSPPPVTTSPPPVTTPPPITTTSTTTSTTRPPAPTTTQPPLPTTTTTTIAEP